MRSLNLKTASMTSALAVILCFNAAPAFAWTLKSIPDRLSGKNTVFLEKSLRVVDNPRGKTFIILASLAVDCDTVVMSFSSIIGGPKNATVSIRAGNKQPLRKALDVTPDLHGAYAVDARARRIVSYLSNETTLYGEVLSATIGKTAFEADITGLQQAMRSANMACARGSNNTHRTPKHEPSAPLKLGQ